MIGELRCGATPTAGPAAVDTACSSKWCVLHTVKYRGFVSFSAARPGQKNWASRCCDSPRPPPPVSRVYPQFSTARPTEVGQPFSFEVQVEGTLAKELGLDTPPAARRALMSASCCVTFAVASSSWTRQARETGYASRSCGTAAPR